MKPISYARHQFPQIAIQYAVWFYLPFNLSLRDVDAEGEVLEALVHPRRGKRAALKLIRGAA